MSMELKLYVNLFTKDLIRTPTSEAQFFLPDFFQGDKTPMKIQLLEPDPDGDFNSFSKPDIDNMSLKLAVGAEPVGDTPESPFVTAYSWTKDVVNKWFSAPVNFNTGALDTWLGSAYEKEAYLEIEVTEDLAIWTVLQKKITIKAQVIEPASTEVATGETPLSLEMAKGMFVSYRLPPGRTVTFVSDDETAERIVGVDNDANPIDDPIEVV